MTLRTFQESDALPDRIVLYAQKGWGKTTLGAFAPKPIIFMSRGETGYLTLRRNNLVPDAPFAIIDSWDGLRGELNQLLDKGPTDRETLVLDVLGGFERLCQEWVCKEKYAGDWGPKGFMNYMVGYRTSGAEFATILPLLDVVSAKLKLRILILAHSRVAPFNNPAGASFDRYAVDSHEKTWEPINGWCDTLLFGRFRTVVVEKAAGEAKGVGGTERVIHCEHCDAWEAKNRHGLPRDIIVPSKPEKMWETLGAKLGAAVDPNAARKAWANDMAAKAATKKTEEKPKEPDLPKNPGEQVGNMFELVQLIAKHKLESNIPIWHKHFKVDDLNKLRDDQVANLITKIKAAKEAVK